MSGRRQEATVVELGVVVFVMLLIIVVYTDSCQGMSMQQKRQLREEVLEMFNHAYNNYMTYAYPADELMPLSCQGRSRGTHPSRGDVDDCLGNFSLTLVDTLDTLVVLGLIDEFEQAVRLVIRDVTFDRDIVVSVFETNIRMLGGLLGGHVMAEYVRDQKLGMQWYNAELLNMAKELGLRILPAFNTTTGMPYPRVNLRHGVKHHMARTGHEKDTCTACAGTMILEFAALSRLTGDPIFESKAAQAMDSLWKARHRTSDLVGTVINIHNGDWVRRDSGVGAGIDSYYEYLLKAYILLGDEMYLDRFNKHYAAVMKYINQGPMLVDVHMHKPLTNSRNFMDALMGFWPGLQVLKGDIKPAIEIHEMLYQVTRRHNFLPEAFTTDFRVHWGQHPLRPEFVESTYFIYKATGDPYYLEVGKSILDNLNEHARVQCGFAAIKDVTVGSHEDQMDSYVLAETFKYLYLLFSEREDLIIDVDDYVFTTEAHLLPLSVSMQNSSFNASRSEFFNYEEDDELFERSCPNSNYLFRGNVNFAQNVRSPLKNYVDNLCPKSKAGRRKPKLQASTFIAGNTEQMQQLKQMGIRIVTMNDGRVQLLHTASEAASPEDAEDGMLFMQEMIELSKSQSDSASQEPRIVQFMTPPYFGNIVLQAGPAQFGQDLKLGGVQGKLAITEPYKCCQPIQNAAELQGKIGIVERGECMFIDKARQLEAVGAIGGIVLDNTDTTSSVSQPLFAMSGDGKDGVNIPLVFLFHSEAQKLLGALKDSKHLRVYMADQPKSSDIIMRELLAERNKKVDKAAKEGKTHVDYGEDEAEEEKVKASDLDKSQSVKTTTEKGYIVNARAVLSEYLELMKSSSMKSKSKQFRDTEKEFGSHEDEDEDEDIVGPGNVKQAVTKTDQESGLGGSSVKVFEELVKVLMGHSEGGSEEDENLQLYNLGKAVQSAFGGADSGQKAENVLTQLAALRQQVKAEIDGKLDNQQQQRKSSSLSEEINEVLDGYVANEINRVMEESRQAVDKLGSHHYASAEELEGECPIGADSESVDSQIAAKVRELQDLGDEYILMDDDGNIYDKNGRLSPSGEMEPDLATDVHDTDASQRTEQCSVDPPTLSPEQPRVDTPVMQQTDVLENGKTLPAEPSISATHTADQLLQSEDSGGRGDGGEALNAGTSDQERPTSSEIHAHNKKQQNTDSTSREYRPSSAVDTDGELVDTSDLPPDDS